MTSAVAIVESTATEAIPRNVKLSGSLWTGYRFLHRVHRLWYWCGRAEIYTNPDNFLKLAAGHAINWVAGDRLMVRVAAQAVMISTRILLAIREQVALWRESKQLWHKISDPYALPPKVKWSGVGKSRFLSPSTKNWWRFRCRAVASCIVRIVKALFQVLMRLFTMSMRMMDAIAAFSYNPQNPGEAVNEFFVNCSQTMDLLVRNREVLLDCLHNNKRVITKILRSVHSIFTVEQLISTVEKTLNVTEKVNGVAEGIGTVGRDLLKRITYGFFQTVGMTEYLPASWVPPLRPPETLHQGKVVKGEKYPPVEWVTFKTVAPPEQRGVQRTVFSFTTSDLEVIKGIGEQFRFKDLKNK